MQSEFSWAGRKTQKTFFHLSHLFPCPCPLGAPGTVGHLLVGPLSVCPWFISSPSFGSKLWKNFVPVLYPRFQTHLWPFSFCSWLCFVGWLTLAAPGTERERLALWVNPGPLLGWYFADWQWPSGRCDAAFNVAAAHAKTALEAFHFSSLGTPGSCFYVLLLSACILFHSFHITWDSRWEYVAR